MDYNNQFTFGSFEWFTGVVEDINDPLKVGRIKVRIHGYHPSDKESVSTEDLPWAMISHPVSSAATNGIGFGPHGMIIGTHVIGFFLDGKSGQQPMIMFTFPGMNDGKPDLSELTRGKTESKEQKSFNNWKEKQSNAAPEYPHNKTITTTSGHVIEIDDTPGKERIKIKHKSGSFNEYHTDGSNIDNSSHKEIIVDKDFNLFVGGNANIMVTGNVIETINGNKTSNISGNYKIKCNAYLIETEASYTEKVGSSAYTKCGGTYTAKASTIFLN